MLITETNKLVAKVYHIQHLSTLLLPLPGMIFPSKGSVQGQCPTGNWKTRKRGNRNGNRNGNNLKDVENVSQSRGHTLAKSLR